MSLTNKRPSPETIFKLFGTPIQDGYTQEDLDYCQLQFLSANSSPAIVESLVQSYHLCPWLVADTLLVIYDDPSICSIAGFSYGVLVEALDTDKIPLIEELCTRRTSIYLNLLYRVSWSTRHSVKSIEDLDILLSFKGCLKVFESKEVWGLNRMRAGVIHLFDEAIMQAAKSSPTLDITQINKIRMEAKRLIPGIQLSSEGGRDEFDDQRPINNLQNAFAPFILGVDGPYHLPFFLDVPFSSLRGFDPKEKLTQNDLAAFSNIENRFYDIMMKLVPNPATKDNFCALIENVYMQDRTKLKFEEKSNCSDSFCYSILMVLLRIAKGIFNPTFIDRIDEKKFPTFCFFNISRMMEISLLRLVSDVKEEYNAPNSLFLLRRQHELIQQYFNFVYDLIDRRKDEVFEILRKGHTATSGNNGGSGIHEQLDCFGGIIDFAPEDKKATRVCEILEDHSFLSTILSIQPILDCRRASKAIFTLINAIFTYKNTMKSSSVKVLGLMDNISGNEVLIKRLISHYSNKHDDGIVEDRYILHEVLRNVKIEVTKDALRMISVCLGSFEEKISQIFDFINSINHYKSKGLMLEDLLKTASDSADSASGGPLLSDDEEEIVGLPRHALQTMGRMTDAELRAFVRSRASGDFDAIYSDIKNQIAFLDSEVKTKIYTKIKVNKHRLANAEKSLKGCAMFLERLLNFLKSFTVINKRLFLNKGVFFRMFSIVNSSLSLLVGEKSLKIRIPNKNEYNFNPKEILRNVELIILNMLRHNEKLIKSSGVDAVLLERAIELSQNKHLLMEDQVLSLREILEVLRDVDKDGQKKDMLGDEDVPDEFLDPLTCLVMENPVTLLTSRVTVDRSTFNQIMLNDQIDPFNRASLDESKIAENLELKERIRQFWEDKK